MEPIKLKTEELDKLKEIQQKNNAVAVELGNVELSKIQLENRRKEIITFLEELREEEKTLGDELSKNYGSGTLNLETGEFVPAPAEETAEPAEA